MVETFAYSKPNPYPKVS